MYREVWRPFLALLSALLLLVGSARADSVAAVPELKTRVTDTTGTISAGQAKQLEAALLQLENERGAQVAVLVVATTRPETIEQYGLLVATGWKLWRKGVSDGALVLVAKDDRKVRIEVGYGLEGVLSDIACQRIIRDDITPRFKAGDFGGGVAAGVAHMARLIRSEPEPVPVRNPGHGLGFWVLVLGVPGALLGWLLFLGIRALVREIQRPAIRVPGRYDADYQGGAGVSDMGSSSDSSSSSGSDFSGGGGDFGGGGSSGDW